MSSLNYLSKGYDVRLPPHPLSNELTLKQILIHVISIPRDLDCQGSVIVLPKVILIFLLQAIIELSTSFRIEQI